MSAPSTNASQDRPPTAPADGPPDHVGTLLAPLHGSGHDHLAHEIREAVNQSPFLARQFRKTAEKGGIASIGTTSNPDALGAYYPGRKDIAVNSAMLESIVSRDLPGPVVDPHEHQSRAERWQDALTWVVGHEVWHADCALHNPHGVPDLASATWRASMAASAMNPDRPRLDMTARVNQFIDSRLDEEAHAQLQGINALVSRVGNEAPLAQLANGSTARALLSPGVAEWEWSFPAQMSWSSRLDWAVHRHRILERIQQTGLTGCVQYDERGVPTPHDGIRMAPDGTLDARSLPALRECAVSSNYRPMYFAYALDAIRHGTENASFDGEVRLDLAAVGIDARMAQMRMAELWKHGHRLTIHDPNLGAITFGEQPPPPVTTVTVYGTRPSAAADGDAKAPEPPRPAPASTTPAREPLQLQIEQAFHNVLPEGAMVSRQRLAQFTDEARTAGFRPGEAISASLDGTRVTLHGQHPTHVASIDLSAPPGHRSQAGASQEGPAAHQVDSARPPALAF